jgi:hypothetical protein
MVYARSSFRRGGEENVEENLEEESEASEPETESTSG